MGAESNSSILESVKFQLGIHSENTEFDDILVFDINSVFSILNQMGIGPSESVTITGSQETWDILGFSEGLGILEMYVALRVRIMFDPSASTQVSQAIQKTVEELEYRLHLMEGLGVNDISKEG